MGTPLLVYSILEYIDISNTPNALEARKFILGCEQFYSDLIFSGEKSNTYYILSTAGLCLGSFHSAGTNAKMSVTQKSLDRAGENLPMFGKSHSAEARTLISEAKLGEKPSMLGKTYSAFSKAKMSFTKGSAIYVYDKESSLVNTFCSARKAVGYFNCYFATIIKCIKNKKIFKKEWIYQHL